MTMQVRKSVARRYLRTRRRRYALIAAGCVSLLASPISIVSAQSRLNPSVSSSGAVSAGDDPFAPLQSPLTQSLLRSVSRLIADLSKRSPPNLQLMRESHPP